MAGLKAEENKRLRNESMEKLLQKLTQRCVAAVENKIESDSSSFSPIVHMQELIAQLERELKTRDNIIDTQLRLRAVTQLWNILLPSYQDIESDDKTTPTLPLGVRTDLVSLLAELLEVKVPVLRDEVSKLIKWDQLKNIILSVHVRDIELEEVEEGNTSGLIEHLREFTTLVRHARWYFSPKENVMKEIVEEFEDALKENSMNKDIFIAQSFMELFLPPPQIKDFQYSVSLVKKIIENWWPTISDSGQWDEKWMSLLRRIGKHNPNVDWAPYLPFLFEKIQKALSLHATGKEIRKYPVRLRFWTSGRPISSKAAKLAIELLGNGENTYESSSQSLSDITDKLLFSKSEKQKASDIADVKTEIDSLKEQEREVSTAFVHLRRLLSSISTLYHPSNFGRRSFDVLTFLGSLCASFAKRLGREVASSDSSRLSMFEKRSFVNLVLPLAKMGLMGKSENARVMAGACFTQMAWVAPMTVFETITPLISLAFDPNNLTQVHLVPVTLQALDLLLQPFLQARLLLPRILPRLLPLTLPGIDPNDSKKTLLTLRFYETLLRWIPVVDTDRFDYSEIPKVESCAWEHVATSSTFKFGIDQDSEIRRAGDMESERIQVAEAMWNAGPVMSEWSIKLIERLFVLFEHQESIPEESGMAQKMAEFNLSQTKQTISLLFNQMDPHTKQKAEAMITEWALNTTPIAKEYCEHLIHSSFAASESKKDMLESLFVQMGKRVINRDNYSGKQVDWALTVMGSMISVAGLEIVQVETMLDDISDSIMNDTEADLELRKSFSDLLELTLIGLLGKYPLNSWSSFTGSDWKKNAVSWGQGTPQVELDIHEPSTAELDMAVRLRDKFLSLALTKMDSNVENGQVNSDDWRPSLSLFASVVSGCSDSLDTTDASTQNSREHLIEKSTSYLNWLLSNCNTPALHKSAAVCVKKSMLIVDKDGKEENQFGMLFKFMSGMVQPCALKSELMALNSNSADAGALYENDYKIEARSAKLQHMVDNYGSLLRLEAFEKHSRMTTSDVYSRAFLSLQNACFHDWKESREKIKSTFVEIASQFPLFLYKSLDSLMDNFNTSMITDADANKDQTYARLSGAYLILKGNAKISRWISTDLHIFEKFVYKVLKGFDASKLSIEQQKETDAYVQEAIVGVLNRWSMLPVSNETIKVRDRIIQNICEYGNKPTLTWRTRLTLSGCLSTLIRSDRKNPDILWNWFVNSLLTSKNVSLQTNAFFALAKLMLAGPHDQYLDEENFDGKIDFTSEEFLQATVSIVSQRHVSEIENADEDSSKQSNSFMDNIVKMFGAGNAAKSGDWSFGVEEMMNYPRITSDTAWLHHDSDFMSNFSFSNAFGFFMFTNRLGLKYVENMLPILKALLVENKETIEYKANLITASEVIAGILRSSSLQNSTEISEIIKADLLPLVVENMDEVGLVAGQCWIDAAKFSSSSGVSQTNWLNLVLGSLSSQKSATIRVITKLRVTRVLLEHVNEEDDLINSLERLSPCLRLCCSYNYQSVREEAGVSIAAALHKATQMDATVEPLKALIDDVIRLECGKSEDGNPTYDSALYLGLVLGKIGGYESYVVRLVPTFLEAIDIPDIEQNKKYKAICLNIVSAMTSDGSQMVEQIVTNGLVSDSWQVRLASLTMIDSILSRQSQSIGFSQSIVCRKSIERMLYDPEIKVQQFASLALRNVISSFHPESCSLQLYVEKYCGKLYKRSKSKKQNPQLPAIFGLSSAVKAFPYSVPSTASVAALSRIKVKEAKTTIEEFKRTHHDTWEFDKNAFTPEELEDITGSTEVYGYA